MDEYKRVKEAKERELWDKIQKLRDDETNKLLQLNACWTGRALNRAQEVFANYEQLRKYYERLNGNKDETEYWKTRSKKAAYLIVRLQIRWAKKVDQIFRVD